MALQEVTASFLRRVRGQTGPLARAQRLQCQRYASTEATSDTQDLEETSFTQAPPPTSKFPKYDPLARSRKYTGKLPPSRYQFRSPKYYRGPLHPHQPPPPSDPSSREFIPGPFSLPRLKQTYDSTTAPDLMTLAYVHHPPGYTAPQKSARLRPWQGASPYFANRPLRGPRGGDTLRLLRKEYGWQDIPAIERVTVHTFVKDAASDSARLHVAGMVLQAITSVRATSHAVKKSLAGFNIRAGQYLSVTSDLQGESMHHFLSECIDVVMPKIKDWRGVKGSSGDGSGNISFGFTAEEVALWPGVEVNYDMYPPKMIPGIHVTSNTSTINQLDKAPETQQSCTIKVIDYSSKRITHHDVAGTSLDLQSFLTSTPKPTWAACRWIYVNGLDHEVIKSLGQARDLHGLAIEDVLERSAPSKVDWYSNNCFMVLAWQRLVNNAHRHSLTEVFQDEASAAEQQDTLSPIQRGLRQRTKWCSTSHREFGLSSEHVSAFMTSDNTIITIFEGAGDEVLHLILHQLESSRTILRSSNDPSMLIHAVIDAVVDLAVPIERAIAEAFAELESAVLENPDIKQSKELYRLRSALTILMDDISAIGSVVKSLCDHQEAPTLSRPDDADPTSTPQEVLVPISPLAKIYLQDVNDHITMLANATLRGVHSAENLTSLIFNTITARQNGSVQRLTIVSIFFLPLTFLTGYFGMNFESMPSVNENTEGFFWVIAGPVMLGTMILLAPSPRWLSWFKRKAGRRR
ncbi:hypothetical protein B0A48_09694 [Cryoendolithus antarcticus]|uniref:Uncharacterized protein n=1 Tax=Cryoendolithus antarcticus TaxID=1507870 RepID=A0A1V8T0B4_9PEZI|nr:hypothetical protein B0A48_09694 [Cryoendolithus antarcticus]